MAFLEPIGKGQHLQHDTRAALEASEAHFRALADSVAIMIWAEDADGRVQYSNRHWFEYTGLPKGAPGLAAWQDAVHPDDLKRMREQLPPEVARGDVIRVNIRLRRHDGVYRWHSCTAVPIRDAAGNVVQRLGSATDIEDQQRAIETLQRERELRERFVVSLSHDLRSPLTAARMGTQLLPRSADQPERLQQQVARVIRNIDRADQLIQNLLDVTRISAGEPLMLERAECDLTAIARQLLEDQAPTHGDRFVLDAPPSLRGEFDPSAIRRLLENLIGNALKYGDAQDKVSVRLDESADEVQIAVHNSGDPIPPEDLALIFQPYQRGREAGQRSSGWGLGLTLVRGIAAAHRGKAKVRSEPGTGTTFTVTLPKSAPAAPAAAAPGPQ